MKKLITINGKKYKPIKESEQHILKENYERFFGKNSLNEAAKGLRGYQKYVEKKKGELLFYAESPDGEVFMGLEKTKNGKFDLGIGTMGMIGPTGGQTSALDGPDEYSSLSQAKSGIKNQMSLAKQGYAHPDEKKFSWKVVVDKLNESLNEYSISDSD